MKKKQQSGHGGNGAGPHRIHSKTGDQETVTGLVYFKVIEGYRGIRSVQILISKTKNPQFPKAIKATWLVDDLQAEASASLPATKEKGHGLQLSDNGHSITLCKGDEYVALAHYTHRTCNLKLRRVMALGDFQAAA